MTSAAPFEVAESLAAHAVEMMVDPKTGMPFYADAITGRRLPAEGVAAGPAPTADWA